jgi:sodium/hydrogen antiporter
MEPFNLDTALFSIIVIVLGLFYKVLQKTVVSEILLSVVLGIALSPLVFDILRVTEWGRTEDIMEKACRLTLAMALMATAFRTPHQYLKNNVKVQATLLLLIMPAMFLSSAAIVHFLAGFGWQLSLLVGAVVTPTDPVLAGSIVTAERAKKWLPQRTRDALSFEAGANDGLAFPFVMLCVLLIEKPGRVWQQWLTQTLLWQTGGAIVLGLAVGYVLGALMEWCIQKKFTAKPAFLAFSLLSGLFVVTALEVVGVNSILAVFMAGLMLKKSFSSQEAIEEKEIAEMMSRLFTIPVFVLFGLVLPWERWLALGWTAPGIVGLVLAFRRLPFLFLARPLLADFARKDLAFMGWFGPVGVAALFYSFYVYKKLHIEEVWTISSLVVFGSVIAHGMTAYPLLKQYRKHQDGD